MANPECITHTDCGTLKASRAHRRNRALTCSSYVFKFQNSPTMLFIKITYCHLEFISDQTIFDLCFLYRRTEHRLLLSFLAGLGGPSLFLENNSGGSCRISLLGMEFEFQFSLPDKGVISHIMSHYAKEYK